MPSWRFPAQPGPTCLRPAEWYYRATQQSCARTPRSGPPTWATSSKRRWVVGDGVHHHPPPITSGLPVAASHFVEAVGAVYWLVTARSKGQLRLPTAAGAHLSLIHISEPTRLGMI